MRRLMVVLGVFAVMLAGFVGSGCECGSEEQPQEAEEGGGETVPPNSVKISGQLTNQVNSYWKVKISSSDPITNIYADPDDSGKFSVYVPRNATFTVIAFLDLNKNGIMDAGVNPEPSSFGVEGGSVVLSNLDSDTSISLNAALKGQAPLVGTTCYKVEGTLTGAYSSAWKVKAEREDSSKDYYGVVNTSSGAYFIYLPSGTYRIMAFRDDNGNSVYDNGTDYRFTAYDSTNISANTSGLDINIPAMTNFVVSGTVNNNVYGLKVGVFAFSGSKKFSSPPSTSSSFAYSLTLEVEVGAYVNIGIYVDKDGDNSFDYETSGNQVTLADPFMQTPNGFNINNDVNVDLNLLPRHIAGTADAVSGNDSNLKLVSVLITTNGDDDEVFGYFSTSYGDGPYEINYYLVTNFYGTNYRALVYVSEDEDNDGFFDRGKDTYAIHISNTNGGIDISSAVTNNGIDMYLNCADAVGNVSGDGEGQVMTFVGCMLGGMEDSQGPPALWKDKSTYGSFSYRMYKVTNMIADYLVAFYKDSDVSGGLTVGDDGVEDKPVYYIRSETWSNQTSFSNDFVLYTSTFNVSITGDEASEFKVWINIPTFDNGLYSTSDFPMTWYLVQNETNYLDFYVWRDLNGNNFYDYDGDEPLIGYKYDDDMLLGPMGLYNTNSVTVNLDLQRQVISGTNGATFGYSTVIKPFDTNTGDPITGFVGGNLKHDGSIGNESYTLTNYWNVNEANTNDHASVILDGTTTYITNIPWTNQSATVNLP